MLTKRSYHRLLTSRAIPELAKYDAEEARSIILETVIGQVRVCAFPPLWRGATTTQPPR